MSGPAEGTRWERALDSIVGAFSPRRAALRKLWRAVDRTEDGREILGAFLRQRGYASTTSKIGDVPWDDTHASADAELNPVLDKLRNRSRQANRDDAIASGLSLTRELNVVGPEITPQSRTGVPAKDDALESVWKERKDLLDPVNRLSQGAGQRLRLRKIDEDGEIFVSRVVEGDRLWFEVIESDRVAITYPIGASPSLQPNSAPVTDGVEKDMLGRPTAYHVWDYAPGAYQRGMVGGLTGINRVRRLTVDQCRHVKRTQRPGQTRGVPANHAVLRDLRDLDLLLVASLKRTQIAACLAAFIQSSETTPDILPTVAEEYGYELSQRIEPGMIFRLYPGESVTPFVPSFPFPEIEPLIVMVARRIGAARGVSWQTVLNDWSQSNYSSARTQLLEDRQSYLVDRKQLTDELLTWEWVQVQEHALLTGHPGLVRAGVTPEDIRAVEWIAFGWSWVDPQKEAAAVQIEMEIGLTTLRDEAAARGRDWEDLLRQRLLEEQRENEIREELGLPPKVEEPGAGGQQPGGGQPAQDDDTPSADEANRWLTLEYAA